MAENATEHLLREGIAAARAGHKEQARDLLLQVIAQDEESEAAWLWLSGVVDDPAERQICLENVLTLDPDNVAARRGLDWLRAQGLAAPDAALDGPPAAKGPGSHPATRTASAEPAPAPEPEQGRTLPPPSPRPVAGRMEIEPYGCPYCGGPVSADGSHCDHCSRPVVVRYRKQAGGVGWPVVSFFLLGITAGLEGYLVAQLVGVGRLPQWLSHTAVTVMVGPALFDAEGVGDLADFASIVTAVNYGLAGLCLLAALGLALKSRAAYFGSFLLASLIAMTAVAGLVTQLTGWLPALYMLGLVALSIKWLVDSAPAFEWITRRVDADIDGGLKTDLDYYNRGQRYYEQGLWAKAAAHWQVAARLAPSQVQYRAELANAYLRMGYPAAALAEIDRTLARSPGDEGLRAFRESVAILAQEGNR